MAGKGAARGTPLRGITYVIFRINLYLNFINTFDRTSYV